MVGVVDQYGLRSRSDPVRLEKGRGSWASGKKNNELSKTRRAERGCQAFPDPKETREKMMVRTWVTGELYGVVKGRSIHDHLTFQAHPLSLAESVQWSPHPSGFEGGAIPDCLLIPEGLRWTE